jgi:hypothetical protein
MAVGITDRNSTGLATPLFWRFRDSRWTTPAKAAVPADAIGTGLVAVECESPAACTAGGGYAKVRNEGLTLAEAWNGKKWIAEATPNPTAATSSDINALSCASADSCTAVGTYFNASYDAQTLVMQR